MGDLIPHLYQWTDHPDRKLITQTMLNYMLDQIDLNDLYEPLHLKAVEYTFFSNLWKLKLYEATFWQLLYEIRNKLQEKNLKTKTYGC